MTPTDKILGVHVNDNLMWNYHFQHVSKQISSYLWLLNKLRSYLSIEHRLMFYIAYISTVILFGATLQVETSTKSLNYKDVFVNLLLKNTDIQKVLHRLTVLFFDQIIFLKKPNYCTKTRRDGIATVSLYCSLIKLFFSKSQITVQRLGAMVSPQFRCIVL